MRSGQSADDMATPPEKTYCEIGRRSGFLQITLYNREKAVAYAHRWAYGHNPAYYNFEKIGGDCTNFTSQCILNGNAVMNYTPVMGWYYKNAGNRSPSWTGVGFLYTFITANQSFGPFAEEVNVSRIEPGDFVQLSFDGNAFQHSPFVLAGPAFCGFGSDR
jgi:hypothetical protein